MLNKVVFFKAETTLNKFCGIIFESPDGKSEVNFLIFVEYAVFYYAITY